MRAFDIHVYGLGEELADALIGWLNDNDIDRYTVFDIKVGDYD